MVLVYHRLRDRSENVRPEASKAYKGLFEFLFIDQIPHLDASPILYSLPLNSFLFGLVSGFPAADFFESTPLCAQFIEQRQKAIDEAVTAIWKLRYRAIQDTSRQTSLAPRSWPGPLAAVSLSTLPGRDSVSAKAPRAYPRGDEGRGTAYPIFDRNGCELVGTELK